MNEPEKQPCRRCFVIRFFILGVVMLALIGLLGGDKLVYRAISRLSLLPQ